ncbi:MAG: hypothetical protein ABI832_11515 [bacterium]
MTLAETEYQSLRVHLYDLKETLQGMERQMRDLAESGRKDAGLIFALAATVGTFGERLDELEDKLGI